jgi:hypothetical protein
VRHRKRRKLKAERDALLDRLARLQAEFDNARKRAVREQQEFREFAAADVIKNVLPILDSFERALKAGGDASDFRSGIELIYRQFQDALQKIGVQPIAAVGQPLIRGFTKRSKWWIRPRFRIITCSTNCSAATSIRSGCCVRRWCGWLAIARDSFDSLPAVAQSAASRSGFASANDEANEQRLTTDDRICN